MSSSIEPSSAAEPIAVIGMSCRLPGATGPDEFWQLLRNGRDAIGEAPADRGREASDDYRRAGYLEDVDRFDAQFFGIPAAEAAAMDPQQRLVLELAVEALEHARIVPDTLRGTAAGVFLGAITADYGLLHDRLGETALSPYSVTGTHRSIIANRVSYLLGLRGPSLTLDSGQSSSLVAVQLACEELRSGATALAIAGGVNLNLLAQGSAALGEFGALSPTGRCHTFDSRANGYVRGEGGGLVVLKPLSVALADGDRIHSVILGGAVNNDGGGAGLTVPDARAHAEVIRLACRRAGVEATEVGYVELHGTGTSVGDPIEAAGLGSALGTGNGRDAGRPLLVGSAKTNVGHLEGAAGIVGLLKTVLSLRHRTLVPSLNFETVNPGIPLERLGLDVVRTVRDWPATDTGTGSGTEGRLVAGVSAFGMGGTNCHLVLATAPGHREPSDHTATTPGDSVPGDAIPGEGPGVPWLLSARSAPALRAQAGRLSRHLTDHPATAPADVALSLLRTRTRFTDRAVVLGSGRTELLAALDELAAGRPADGVLAGRVVEGGVGFVFPGQGSQWPEMARQLMDVPGPFADSLAACSRALAPYLDYDLLELLRGGPDATDPLMQRVDVIQPALWAVMVSLAQWWQSHGVRPDLVIGHSQGEMAAATFIGALSLEDSARVVALRSLAVARISGGGMLSVLAPAAVLADRLAGVDGIGIAVINGPRSTVLSGDAAALAEFRNGLDADGFRSRAVPVDYASHSAAVESLREELLDLLAPIRPVSTATPFYSSLMAGPMDTAGLDAHYWYRSLRNTVDFAGATRAALGAGCGLFIECSPHPVLTGAVEETAEEADREIGTVGTLRRTEGGPERLRRSLAEAGVLGAPVDWDSLCATPGARLTDLPTYAFQRERHWLDGTPQVRESVGTGAGDAATGTAATTTAATVTTPAAMGELVATTALSILDRADGAPLDPTRSFKDLGFDSLGSVELRNRLRAVTGLRLPTTLLFEYPTPDRLAGRLAELLNGGAPAPAAPPAPKAPAAPAASATGRQDVDPIAVVAMSCRYPGQAASPEELWQLVAGGVDAISALPTDRGWDLDSLLGAGPGNPGSCATPDGGFLHDAAEFDAGFFGLSPREALAMDPQQRLLLEASWEAVERAGIDPSALAGQAVGVFAGAMASDYGPRLHQPTGGADGHLLTGTALSVISGRVAYTLGLRGPALTVDTACSSSLVAIHLAVQSLRRGECSLALAGGVTVMSNPGNLVEFSRQQGLATDGRAKPFAAGADGTSFAEGAGILVLERLSDARRHGHPVLAVIRGTAVNQDGASNGLTAPDGGAQRELIGLALADARLDAADIDAVEAHGTGTRLGDPIEANAILATYGSAPADGHPLWLGSVKSNIGHTQAAAGVAGVIKMILAMRHELLPRTLHVDQPTPLADWDGHRVRLLTQQQPWPRGQRVRRAAVSSFGISGTNAHLIVEEPQPVPAPAGTAGTADTAGTAGTRPTAWALSARSETSLRGQARRLLAAAGSGPETPRPADVARTLGARSRFEHRAVVWGSGPEELLAGLTAVSEGRTHPGAVTAVARGRARTALLFTGQGGQRLGMGRELYGEFPVFAQAFDAACAHLDPHLDRPLRTVVWADPDGADAGLLDETRFTQPALFAFEVAAFRLLESLGVTADTVAGHSVGEFAAAHVAGVWDLADAARLVAVRGRLMQDLPAGGAMVAIATGAEDVAEDLVGREHQVGLAAVNGPSSVVLSGEAAACREIARAWAELGYRTKELTVSHAFHSPLMEPMLDRFAQELAGVAFAEPRVPYEAALGEGRSWTDPDYWVEQVRRAVLFAPMVERLAAAGTAVFLEVGPQAVLAGMARECLADRVPGRATEQPAVVAAIGPRRGRGEHESLLSALAEAFAAGTAVDWAATAPGGDRVELPTYAFDRRRFWLTGQDTTAGALLQQVVAVAADGGHLLSGRLSRRSAPWLVDHTIAGTVLVPGTAFVELALRAAFAAGAAGVGELTLQAPLVLPAQGAVEVQVAVGGEDARGRRTLTVHARPAGADPTPWTLHATGHTTGHPAPHSAAASSGLPGGAWPPAGSTPVDLDGLYQRLAAVGYDYGPAFRGLTAAWRSGEDLFAEVRLPQELRASAGGFTVHPALLDSVLHLLVLEAAEGPADAGLLVPFSFSDVSMTTGGPTDLRVRLTPAAGGVRLQLSDTTGRSTGEVGSVALRPVPRDLLAPTATGTGVGLYDLAWVEPGPLAARATAQPWAVLEGPRSAAVAAALTGAGVRATVVRDLDALLAADTDPVPPVLVAVCDDTPATARRTLHEVLELVRRTTADERLSGSRLVLAADPRSLAGAPVWGLVRSALAEYPEGLTLVDIAEDTAGSWAHLVAAVANGEPQCAVRADRLLVPRLAPRPMTTGADGAQAAALDTGTVLITGGTGGLGGWLAEHLVDRHGVRDLLLASRRGPAAQGVTELVERLRARGATVRVAACDVGDRDDLAGLLESVPPRRPLVAVVHAAGILDDCVIDALTPERLDAVLRPKADAARLLHELTAELPLRAFVLFSSVAGVLGTAGQANYAAANTSLDALAAQRRLAGLPAVSIAWGLWSSAAGMGAGLSALDEARLARTGLGSLSRQEGLELFDQALRTTAHSTGTGADQGADPAAGTLVAARLDLAGLRSRVESGGAIPAVMRGLVRAARPPARPAQPAGPGAAHPAAPAAAATGPLALVQQLTGLDPDTARRTVLDLVRNRVALVLGHDSADAVGVDLPFTDLGFDSLAAVELREILCEETGLPLPVTLIFDQPTVADVTDYLMRDLDQGTASAGEDLADALDRVTDLLDAVVATTTANPDGLARVEAALQAALQRLRDGSGPPDQEPEEFDFASDEEIFRFIDTQL